MSDDAQTNEIASLLPRGNRQQYHYLYGSSSSLDRVENIPAGARSPTATDQDSLVGEALVPTDNEQEDVPVTPGTSDGDLQQLFMTNGNGVQVLGSNGSHGNGKQYRPPSTLRFLDCFRLRQSQPLLYIITLAGTASLFVIILAVFLLPDTSHRSKSAAAFKMPFARVDRGEFGDPVSKFLNKDLFDPALVNRRGRREFIFPFPTGAFWTNFVLEPTADRGISYPVVVYPYAYAWSDTLLQLSYPASHRREEPQMIHDYFFPDLTLSAQEGTLSRHVTHFDALSVTLRYTTQNGKWQAYLVQGSPYATVRYENTSPTIKAFSTFTSVGCNDNRASSEKDDGSRRRRRLKDDSFGVCAWKEDSTKTHRTLRGVQFRMSSMEGMNWIVFSSEPIELQFDLIGKSVISSVSKFKGVLRIALLPAAEPGNSESILHANTAGSAQYTNTSISTGLQRLVYHAGVYPISGDVSWSFRSSDAEPIVVDAANSILGKSVKTSAGTESSYSAKSGSASRIGTISFQFSTESFTPSSSASTAKPLLMLALPHHAQKLSSGMQLGRDQFDVVFRCIKGPMRPTLGRTWAYDEILPSLGFDDFDPSSNEREGYLDSTVRSVIVDSLKKDVLLALPTVTENTYGFGKQVARLAQLAHIAYMIRDDKYRASSMNSTTDDNMTADDEEVDIADLHKYAIRMLRSSLETYLNCSVSDALVFDDNLGGLVSTDGLQDSGADFGNGRYNDHHFHYGYLLYACAVLGRLDRGFVRQYQDAIDSIYSDIAYDKNLHSEKSDEIFFPGARHKLWFDGHSFASGMFPFGNGKSQESSSEAVNGYFGAYLWSIVKHQAAQEPVIDSSLQTDFARLLLATEMRGAQMYWHMSPHTKEAEKSSVAASATVYSPEFSRNYMVGNLGMLDAVSSTWFGTSSVYVHMINEMPVTAVTPLLFNAQYVEKEYAEVISPLGQVEASWQGYVICNQALVDPMSAWKAAQHLESGELDSGISKSQILYFISTRKQFHANAIKSPNLAQTAATDSSDSSASTSSTTKALSSCSAHTDCQKSGMMGLCCPTSEGVYLECCTENA